MNFILGLLKKHKLIGGILGIGLTAGSLFLVWDDITSSYYDKGFNAATTEYKVKMVEQAQSLRKETEDRLKVMRQELREQYQKEIDRIKADNATDKDVDSTIKYIEKKVYVKEECNTVDPDLIRMLNQSIHRVNGSE